MMIIDTESSQPYPCAIPLCLYNSYRTQLSQEVGKVGPPQHFHKQCSVVKCTTLAWVTNRICVVDITAADDQLVYMVTLA